MIECEKSHSGSMKPIFQGRNHPIVLGSDKRETKVQNATAGMDQKLFVSKYLVVLPTEEELERFIQEDRDRIESKKRGK